MGRKDLLISDYERVVEETDQLPSDAIRPIALGLFGEVGSIMAASKKFHREGPVYTAFQEEVREELGDTLWYLTAVCRRLGIGLETVFEKVISIADLDTRIIAGASVNSPVAEARQFSKLSDLDDLLISLGQRASDLLDLPVEREEAEQRVVAFAENYLQIVQLNQTPLSDILLQNIRKAKGGFSAPELKSLSTFDSEFPAEERIPDDFEIEITQRASGKSYLRMNGVYIGDPLTDNHRDRDGYRFHDVFHLAHAAVLHWSPVFRALIRHKRKSVPAVDEAEDSGRPIVIEEGLTAYVFSYAKNVGFFEEQTRISLSLLKTVQQFVTGYEVESCPSKLWEDAFLQGYEVFRRVREKEGGTIIGNRKDRKISFRE